jgi:hypothetical protein
MGAEQAKSLKERRADLERQLAGLKAERENGFYMPGVTIVSDRDLTSGEQIDLQIEELQAAIAQVDEALEKCSGSGDADSNG